MPVPERPHNAAGKVQLDVVDFVLDLLSNGLNEAVRTVALAGLT